MESTDLPTNQSDAAAATTTPTTTTPLEDQSTTANAAAAATSSTIPTIPTTAAIIKPDTTIPTQPPPTPTPASPPPPQAIWPAPLVDSLPDFEDSSSLHHDLTTLSDIHILNTVKKTGTLRLSCVTWNMHGEKAPSHADMLLLLKPGTHHLVMVTTQECERTADKSILNPSKAAWEAALNVAFGEHYVLVRSHGLAAIHISLLCHRALVPLISHIDSAAVATGLGSRTKDKKIQQQDDAGNVMMIEEGGGGGMRLGNKGGVGISMCLGSSSMLFVGAHLAAHKTKSTRRNQDFHDIDHGLLKKLQSLPLHAQKIREEQLTNKPNVDGKRLGISTKYDHVYWGGDLNYRINGTREAIDSLLVNNFHSVLIENDQLRIEMERNAV